MIKVYINCPMDLIHWVPLPEVVYVTRCVIKC